MTSTYSRFLDVDEIKKSWEVPKFYVNVVSIKEQNVDLGSTCLQSSDVSIYQCTLQVCMAICLVWSEILFPISTLQILQKFNLDVA